MISRMASIHLALIGRDAELPNLWEVHVPTRPVAWTTTCSHGGIAEEAIESGVVPRGILSGPGGGEVNGPVQAYRSDYTLLAPRGVECLHFDEGGDIEVCGHSWYRRRLAGR